MATKEKLLALLKEQEGTYLSGEEIAGILGVSRAAVWKAVKALQSQGNTIDAVTNKGYCLISCPDSLDASEISRLTGQDFWKIQVLPTVPSTNSLLRELANQGSAEGTVILASSQTEGRGRMGRQFFSPEDTGLYLSLLLRPRELSPQESLQLTTMAAAALCLAIEKLTEEKPQIKWVNDLYLKGRKICGILTEASFSMESGSLDYVVLGLGLNLYPPKEGFPSELENLAGSLCLSPREGLKNRLAAEFLNTFKTFYRQRDFQSAGEVYRSRSLLSDKQILVGVEKKKATVLDITPDCKLLVQYEDGSQQALSYGEVSIVNSISI